MTIGPVQLLIVGFAGGEFKGEIAGVLADLRERDVIRLIDMGFVRKDDDGLITMIEHSDLSQDEAIEFGATVGALIGLGAAGEEGAEAGAIAGAESALDGGMIEDQVWYIADEIPEGTAAAIALIEHRWAIPLRSAILNAGGFLVSDAWIHPADLVAIGLLASEEMAES
ncbi:MAG TPA: hypothetical protein VGQ45_09530 [Gaiellales bacterium]|jgi:uncharacterized membrane protein|nr:hypothetical protein [Gaiellales bacterium]